jgi:hypothetical protein
MVRRKVTTGALPCRLARGCQRKESLSAKLIRTPVGRTRFEVLRKCRERPRAPRPRSVMNSRPSEDRTLPHHRRIAPYHIVEGSHPTASLKTIRVVHRSILTHPTSATGHELPFATALHHARMSILSRLHHEKVIRRQSNTSAIPPDTYRKQGQAATPALCRDRTKSLSPAQLARCACATSSAYRSGAISGASAAPTALILNGPERLSARLPDRDPDSSGERRSGQLQAVVGGGVPVAVGFHEPPRRTREHGAVLASGRSSDIRFSLRRRISSICSRSS